MLLAIPLAVLATFALAEMAGGEPSGAQHLLQAAPLLVVLVAAWRYPRMAGFLLFGMGIVLLAGYMILAIEQGEGDAGDGMLWIAGGLLLFAPPLAAGALLLRGWGAALSDPWPLLFVWIIFIPVVTVPLQVERLGGWEGFTSARVHERCELIYSSPNSIVPGFETTNSWRCEAEDVIPTLAPGLLNLLPIAFVWWPRRRTRVAALVTAGLGALRLAAPLLIYAAMGHVTFSTQYFPGPNETSVASLALWILSVLAFIRFPLRIEADEPGEAAMPFEPVPERVGHGGAFFGRPSSRPGWTSLGLIAGFVAFMALFGFGLVAGIGPDEAEDFFDNPYLAFTLLLAAASGILAGVAAGYAIALRHERSFAVVGALVWGLFVLVFSIGEIAGGEDPGGGEGPRMNSHSNMSATEIRPGEVRVSFDYTYSSDPPGRTITGIAVYPLGFDKQPIPGYEEARTGVERGAHHLDVMLTLSPAQRAELTGFLICFTGDGGSDLGCGGIPYPTP